MTAPVLAYYSLSEWLRIVPATESVKIAAIDEFDRDKTHPDLTLVTRYVLVETFWAGEYHVLKCLVGSHMAVARKPLYQHEADDVAEKSETLRKALSSYLAENGRPVVRGTYVFPGDVYVPRGVVDILRWNEEARQYERAEPATEEAVS